MLPRIWTRGLYKQRAVAPSPRRSLRPQLEALEGREVPATLVGLTTANQLVTFDSATPGTLTGSPATITLPLAQTADTLVGIDFRPPIGAAQNGQLYAVSRQGNVFTINYTPGGGAATADATLVGNTGTALTGTSFGVDFNTVTGGLRVIGNDGQSLRVNATTGVATPDPTLAFDPNDPQNQGFFGTTGGTIAPAPQVSGAAYTLEQTSATTTTPAATATTLYGIDFAQDLLVLVGSPQGTPNGPNTSLVTVVDTLRDSGFNQVDFTANNGFDIDPNTNTGFAVTATSTGTASTLYSINLTSATVTSVGAVGGTTATSLVGLAVAPPTAGAGTIGLSSNAATFPTDRGPLAVTVTRTGGSTGTVTVDFATSDGTAVAGVDYLPTNGTLTFGPGVTSRTIFLSVPATTPPASPAKTFTLTLSNPTGGATAGATTSATITIPAVSATPGTGQTPARTPTRFFAVAGGAGLTGQVFVYDSASGALAFTVTPFGAGNTAGMTVAVADVNRDGFDDVIVGAGSGGGPRVAVVDGQSQQVVSNFFAYDPTFRGGVNVAAGDINADGFADVIVGAGDGGGPQVRVFSGFDLTSTTQTVLANFFAYDPTFRGGVNVGSGEFTGDDFADIITGAGNGGGPQVEIFNGLTGALLASYFAYDSTFRGGVFVAGGDVNGNGITDVVTGTGPGGGPNVRTFESTSFTQSSSFFAYQGNLGGGVRVGVINPTDDGPRTIVTGSGVGGPSAVRFFDALGNSAGTDLSPLPVGFTGGVFVG